jgi:hypothetical protein
MATYTRMMLSGDTHGIGKLSAQTDHASAETVHTATASTTDPGDEVWLWASNPDTVAHVLKIWWGGTTELTNEMTYTLPALTADIPLVRGLMVRNSLVVGVTCDVASKCTVRGFVNRIVA